MPRLDTAYYRDHRMTVVGTGAVVVAAVFAYLQLKRTPAAPIVVGSSDASGGLGIGDVTSAYGAGAAAAGSGFATGAALGGGALDLAGMIASGQAAVTGLLAQSQADVADNAGHSLADALAAAIALAQGAYQAPPSGTPAPTGPTCNMVPMPGFGLGGGGSWICTAAGWSWAIPTTAGGSTGGGGSSGTTVTAHGIARLFQGDSDGVLFPITSGTGSFTFTASCGPQQNLTWKPGRTSTVRSSAAFRRITGGVHSGLYVRLSDMGVSIS